MVVKGEGTDAVVEFRGVVASFGAQVIDEIVVFVLKVQEFDDVVDVVTVDAFDLRSGESHCYDVVGNV